MMTLPRMRGLSLCLMLLAWAAASGCATVKHRRFEERYRLFFAKELTEENIKGKTPEQVVALFQPEAAIRRSIEDFEKQGYRLHEIQPIPWGEGATVVIFRRDFLVNQDPDRSPIHYIGTYRTSEDKAPPTYYIFSQLKDGYTVHVLAPDGQKVYDAKWESRELQWQTDAGYHMARLTPDGRCLVQVTDSAQGFDVPRTTTLVRAERMRPIQLADAPDVRDARSYSVRLRPATPSWHDPYPW